MAVEYVRLCCNGDLEGVQAALQSGTDVNSQIGIGKTGLRAALIGRRTAVVRLLLEQEGIDIKICDYSGRTALYDAAVHAECLAIMLARPEVTSEMINKKDRDGRTPLWSAVFGRAPDCVQMFINDDRTEPNIKDADGNSPVMVAIKYNVVDCAALLLPDPRVDLMTRDAYKRDGEEVKRFVEELKNPVMAVLEECINDDNSSLSMLKRIWSDGAAGNLEGRIMEELNHYWTGLAKQGRTLEEAARAPCDGRNWNCVCGSTVGHPELAEMVEEERQRRQDAQLTPPEDNL